MRDFNYYLHITHEQLRLSRDNVDLSGPQQETRSQRNIRHGLLRQIPEIDRYREDLIPDRKPRRFAAVPEFAEAWEKVQAEQARGRRIGWRQGNFVVFTNPRVVTGNEELHIHHLKRLRLAKEKLAIVCGRHGGHHYARPATHCEFVQCKVCDHVYGPVHAW